MTYSIIRFTFNGPNRTIKRGLSLAEAQAWCRDPETSSQTCCAATYRRVNNGKGSWFDGYTEED